MIKTVLVYLYNLSLRLAYIIYQNIQSYKDKHTHISLDKNSNTEFSTDDILSSLNSILQI